MDQRNNEPAGTTTLRTIQRILSGTFLSILFILPTQTNAQGKDSTDQRGVSIHGFVKSDYWMDSRKVLGSREDLFLFYPLQPRYDSQGTDVLDHMTFNFSAVTSRLRFDIAGPDALNAKVSGVMEADFSGISNADIDGFRLRHAYMKLEWQKSDLLLGQYWHPLFTADIIPTVLALNTGAPFQPFIRNPQARYTIRVGQIKIVTAVISQLDFVSEGPQGRSSIYLRDGGYPNIHFQTSYEDNRIILGAAADHKRILPQSRSDGAITNEHLSSFSWMVFSKLTLNRITLKAKLINGENLTEHLLLGGYFAKYDTLHDTYSNYRPTRHINIWLNGTYGTKHHDAGIFTGWSKNTSDRRKADEIAFGRGLDIDQCYRISCFYAYKINSLQFWFEAEYTNATYLIDPIETGLDYVFEEPASNLRFQITAFYHF